MFIIKTTQNVPKKYLNKTFSGSMEPAIYRGDFLFLTNFESEKIQAGEIVVFNVDGKDTPIIHRVMRVHER